MIADSGHLPPTLASRLTPPGLVVVLAIVVAGLSLRWIGARDETRISWGEGRPDIENCLVSPVPVLLDEMGKSWGRPGLVVLKLATLFGWKVLAKLGVGGIAEWIVFTIVLDVASALILMDLVRRWIVLGRADGLVAAAVVGLIWATSPTLVSQSHRFENPVYCLFVLMSGVWLFFHACGSGRKSGFVISGLVFGAAFMVYPGLYHFLLFSPVLLLDRRLRQRLSIGKVCCMGAGFVALPVALEATMQGVKAFARPDYYTYFAQLRDLSKTIVQGSFADVPIFPFRYALACREFWLILVLPGACYAVLRRRSVAWAWFAMVLAIYGFWVVNGYVLEREVLYGRLVVLVYPALMVGTAVALSEALGRWGRQPLVMGCLIAAFCGLTGLIVLTTPRIRVHADDVREHVSAALGVSAGRIALIGDPNDHGEFALAAYKGLSTRIEALENAGWTAVVAFNLRSGGYPAFPRLEFPVEPVLRYPAQGSGRSRRESYSSRSGPYVVKTQRFDDIKVFRARDVLANPPKVLDAGTGG